uniref:profilin-1-like n=1 Tax=Myxine glutinosa TaxID=7769 RepID=UPI00358DECC3
MSWDDYVNSIMNIDNVGDVAIFGIDERRVWAAKPNSEFGGVKTEELNVLLGTDRATFLANGVQLGNIKFSVTNDKLMEDDWMSLQTKQRDPSASLLVVRTKKTVVFVMGIQSLHGGKMLTDVEKILKSLRDSNF